MNTVRLVICYPFIYLRFDMGESSRITDLLHHYLPGAAKDNTGWICVSSSDAQAVWELCSGEFFGYVDFRVESPNIT